jgi:UDP-galactopyranose mutase
MDHDNFSLHATYDTIWFYHKDLSKLIDSLTENEKKLLESYCNDVGKICGRDIKHFARTLPMINMFLDSRPSKEQAKALIKKYRTELETSTKEQIMSRDIDFIYEGLKFALYKLGNHIIEPFLKGFDEIYFTKFNGL